MQATCFSMMSARTVWHSREKPFSITEAGHFRALREGAWNEAWLHVPICMGSRLNRPQQKMATVQPESCMGDSGLRECSFSSMLFWLTSFCFLV